jgi:hypothetical protein
MALQFTTPLQSITVEHLVCFVMLYLLFCLMVFNATFNNMSVLLVEKTGEPGENH